MESDSLMTPTYEPTEISYVRKANETGTETSFVIIGRSIQRDTVTTVEVAIGRIFNGDENVPNANPQFNRINTAGQTTEVAHFFLYDK